MSSKRARAAGGGPNRPGTPQSADTTVAVGTGEMLINRGVIRLLEMRGLLKELPDVQ